MFERLCKTSVMFVFVLLGGTVSFAAVVLGSHGGQVLNKGNQKYEIVTQNQSKEVDVYAEGLATPPPRQLNLRVMKGLRVLNRVTLRLMDQNAGVARFHGELDPSAQKTVGGQFDVEAFK